MNRVSEEKITELKDGEIFVFGSNLAGIHGAGAALAALKFGAALGVGVGLKGQTYAIPTKDVKIKPLHFKEIEKYVIEFYEFARKNQDLTFLVTEVGCGLAGNSYEDIAPMFLEAAKLDNVRLPLNFWFEIIKDKYK